MSALAQAMGVLMDTFRKYAGKDKKTLTKAQLAELLRTELFDGKAPDKTEVDEFFSGLDSDMDGVVDFKEYVTFVAALTLQCNAMLH